MANVLGVKTNVGIRLIIALIKGLEFGLNILEKSWKSFAKSLEKMCGNPVVTTLNLYVNQSYALRCPQSPHRRREAERERSPNDIELDIFIAIVIVMLLGANGL